MRDFFSLPPPPVPESVAGPDKADKIREDLETLGIQFVTDRPIIIEQFLKIQAAFKELNKLILELAGVLVPKRGLEVN